MNFISASEEDVSNLEMEYVKILCANYQVNINTVKPPKSGHFGKLAFVLYSEVVLFSEVVLNQV